jgi:hypothetical protein
VPVRIVFEGLTLFQFPETGPHAGKLVAYLINDAESAKTRPEHDHDTEVLILTGEERGNELVPKILTRDATLDITVPGPKGARPSTSFRQHVPDLGAVIEKATPAIRNAGRRAPNIGLIQNMVTVDRGIVRVKDVTVWDQGGYPLSGDSAEIGERATSPVAVKFMGSTVRGHIASNVAVEIDAEEVQLVCDHDNRFNVPKRGSANPTDTHILPGTVEIRITNYERAGKPTPWGLDFQWLFQAAGYNEADLGGTEFEAWVVAGRAYDSKLFDEEREMFLRDGTVGRPFPYIESTDSLTLLHPLTNPPRYLICVNAELASSVVMMGEATLLLAKAAMKQKGLSRQAPAITRKAPAKPQKKTAKPQKPAAKARKAPAKPRKAKRPKKR